MKTYSLAAEGTKLVLEENVLAVIADFPLQTVSSAFHNGGCKQTSVIVNAQVTKEYGDSNLHDDPEDFIQKTYPKLGLTQEYVGMVTFAGVADFSKVSRGNGGVAVTVVATAGCTHSESSGEEIRLQPIAGTINIIVLIDGNPTESCLTSCIITATEAKTAALRELDVRSLYSGTEATGTITDAMVVAKTSRGAEIIYSGPASPLGQLVGACTRQAVKEAVMKGKIGGFLPQRPLTARFEERHLSVAKMAQELSKVKSLGQDEKAIEAELTRILEAEPALATVLFAAAKVSEEFGKGSVPKGFDANVLGARAAEVLLGKKASVCDDCRVDLPPYLAQVLIALLQKAFSEKQNWKH